ncbi:MAG: hypothetical protein ACK5VI_07135 [Opitutia bacterium]
MIEINSFESALRKHAALILGHPVDLAAVNFWVSLAMVAVLVPYLGRLAAKHFFGKEGSLLAIGAVGLISVGLAFAAFCMADASLSSFVPANFGTLVLSLATCTAVLLIASAASQVLSLGFGPSLGLQVIFWNIVVVANVATRFLTDLWSR